MRVKKIIGILHLWLGLASGLLVFIIAVTGCVYCFQHEIQNALQPYRFVKKQSAPFLPPSQIKAAGEKAAPNKQVRSVLYGDAAHSAQVVFLNSKKGYYDIAYINPYTAEVLKVKDMNSDFFRFVLKGHFYLWLPPVVGKPAVAYTTLIFAAILISGIVLWQPKREKFRIKWNARWRRLNYDLHSVLGFYVVLLALVLALTGLVWGFQWFANAVYKTAGGKNALRHADVISTPRKEAPLIDKVYAQMAKEHPRAQTIEVRIPHADTIAIAATANPDADTHWKTDYRYYDQNTLQEIPVRHVRGRFREAQAADKLLRMNYDIHTGAILGLPGKILAFFASLICASLPVTGFLFWLGRKKKKQRGTPSLIIS